MNDTSEHHESACDGRDCKNCKDGFTPPPDAPKGWRLVVPAMAFFLAPLVLALVGAVGGGPGPTGQVIGAGAGLFLGLTAGAAIAWRLRKAGKEA